MGLASLTCPTNGRDSLTSRTSTNLWRSAMILQKTSNSLENSNLETSKTRGLEIYKTFKGIDIIGVGHCW